MVSIMVIFNRRFPHLQKFTGSSTNLEYRWARDTIVGKQNITPIFGKWSCLYVTVQVPTILHLEFDRKHLPILIGQGQEYIYYTMSEFLANSNPFPSEPVDGMALPPVAIITLSHCIGLSFRWILKLLPF